MEIQNPSATLSEVLQFIFSGKGGNGRFFSWMNKSDRIFSCSSLIFPNFIWHPKKRRCWATLFWSTYKSTLLLRRCFFHWYKCIGLEIEHNFRWRGIFPSNFPLICQSMTSFVKLWVNRFFKRDFCLRTKDGRWKTNKNFNRLLQFLKVLEDSGFSTMSSDVKLGILKVIF